MQSFFAFCSICLQFSNLANLNTEILAKRDEACTLCLVDMFQPAKIDNFTGYNRSSSEIINDGLYFNNPLLQEALKLKMEQQFLVQTGSCVEMNHQSIPNTDPFIKVATQKEAQEALNPLIERLEELVLDTKQIRNNLEQQMKGIASTVDFRTKYIRSVLDKANLEIPNKLRLPQDLEHLFPLLESESAGILKVLPELFERKINGFSGKVLIDIQEFSKEVQKMNTKISQAQSPQEFSDIIQEINLVHNQTLSDLEQQYNLQYQLDKDSILADFVSKTNDMIKQVGEYLKPIKTTLKVGEKLTAGQRFTSENGIFHFIMQGDGSVALLKYERVIWSSDKFDTPSGKPAELVFDSKDGVLKIQDPDTEFSRSLNLENPNYKGNGEAYLTITNAGEIKIIESGVELWSPLYSFPERKVLILRDNLRTREFIVSENEKYTLQITDDLHLLILDGSYPIWRRSLQPYRSVSLNREGKLTTGDYHNIILVNPGKTLKEEPSLIIRNDGKLAIMDGDQEIYNE